MSQAWQAAGGHGIPWKRGGRDPVIRPGALHPPYDAARAGAAHVVDAGDRYRMVYWGSGRKCDVIGRSAGA